MDKRLTASATITIQVPAARVWEALTKPQIIKQYFFGVDVITDWKVGSPIVYRGEWEGKPFEDRGKIVRFEQEKFLVSTHWSPLSGMPDTPENYHTVSYKLEAGNSGTKVTITQDNNASEDEVEHSEQNWKMVLEGLKSLLGG
jgi:uncharacterized protein YndB with AHSA1/START domain